MPNVTELTRKTLQTGAHPGVRAALWVGFVFYFFYHAARFFGRSWPLKMEKDAEQIYRLSTWIAEHGDYPARLWLDNLLIVFPYPPPTPLMFAALGAAGPHCFLAIWITLIAAAFFWSIKVCFLSEPAEIRRGWLLIGMAGLLVAGSAVSWDLRYGNSNLIWLGAVLLGYAHVRKRPMLAGFCVGVSVALKLYSGLLIGWLLLYRPKAAVIAIAVTVCLWVLLPVASFGPAGTVKLYDGWLEQLRIVSGYWVYETVPESGQVVTTVRRAAIVITGAGPAAASTEWLVRSLFAAWTALILWYGWRAWRAGTNATRSRAMLGDWIVLLLFPLPFSPWLEPYHAVPMLPAAVLLVAVALDQNVSARGRSVAAFALAGVSLLRVFFDPILLRGLSMLAQFAFVVAALALLRRELVQQTVEPEVSRAAAPVEA